MRNNKWLESQKLLLGRNLRAVGIFVTFYVLFGLWLTWQQETFIYQPPTAQQSDCPALAEATLETVGDTRLYTKAHSERMVILYHGNAGSVCDRGHYADWIDGAGWGYILVAYSGYGDGSGPPTHERIRQDVQNVQTYIEQQEIEEVYIIGESLGAGVASYHASFSPPQALFLITPFDTLRNLAQYHYWYYPARWLVQDVYDNVSALDSYQGPVTIIHGENDEVVPLPLAEQLYHSLKTPQKQLIVVPEANHNDLLLKQEAREAIAEFLRF